jgi:flagellar biosynthesis/type III secretory pathway protein FliH
MSVDRVIPARKVEDHRIEAFPYFTAHFSTPLPEEGEEGDAPLGTALSSPEEDAKRLASVDQVIFEKLQQAERDALDTARRGYEEGFASGEAEGRSFGESQYRSHIQKLDGHLQELSASLTLNDRAAKDELLALALAIGEYLAGREIQRSGASIGPMLDAILAAHPFPGESSEAVAAVTVHMNPRDLEALGPDGAPRPGVTLKEDPELTRGSLRVEAATGVLDASLEERQARLMELVGRFLEQEQAPEDAP